METTILYNARMVAEERIIDNGYITIHEGQIEVIGTMESCPAPEIFDQAINCEDFDWVLPGMIDIHIHGVGGSDVMDATTKSMKVMTSMLPREGTTSFLPTTITNPTELIESSLRNVAHYHDQYNKPGEAEIIGIHLEGPFINKVRKGAQPEKDIIEPNLSLFKTWQQIANNMIRVVTLAPELDKNHELIKHLKSTNVVASMGHTDATFIEVKDAVKDGLTHATHLFNGMRGVHHREPGTAGAALLLDEIIIELIADGVHTHPEMAKLAYKMKGPEKMVLITDSLRAKCLKNGIYDLGGQQVEVKDGKAWLPDSGSLAGSMLKLHEGRKNVKEWLALGPIELVKMTSMTPAKSLGIYNRKGSIAVGKDADIIFLNSNGDVVMTLCRGKIAWNAENMFEAGEE